MLNELRYALRNMARTPGFTVVATFTLALGIGANVAIFSIVEAVLLRPLPYTRPGELMALHERLPPKGDEPGNARMAIAPPTIRDWASSSSFISIAPYAEMDFIVTGSGEPARVRGANVAPSLFGTLGVGPALGRLLTPDDDGPDRPLVAIIGHDIWRSRFGSDVAVVGRAIELSGRRHTIVGVLPAGFAFPDGAQVWTPLALPEGEFADNQRLSFYLHAVARLRPGVSRDQAEAELDAIAARMAGRFPQMYEGRGATVVPLHDAIVGEVRPALLLLMGTVGLVLLIACANVANLLLARTAARTGEIAVRAALGASRPRILREQLTESLVIAFAGAAAGVLIAMWVRDVIVGLSPADVPRIDEVGIDLPVLGFALLLTVVTTLVFGLAPAVFATRSMPGATLRSSAKGSTGPARHRFRNAIVVAQLAVSLALLTGAGLLGRTFWRLTRIDPGFGTTQVMTMEVMLPRARYPEASQRASFFARVMETLEANPLIESAGGATNLPLSNTNMSFGIYRQGTVPDQDPPQVANVRGVTAGYFETLRIPLLRGRSLSASDREGSAPVVVINDAMRRKLWPQEDPIGQRLSITRGRTVVWREIVGIVGDVRHAGLGLEPEPEVYMPYAHDPFFFLRIAVRSGAHPDVLAGAMRAAVWAVDRDQPVSRVRPMEAIVAASVASQRFNTILIGTFALLALTLAAVGLYGVIAYSVTLRFREFGVRMALGAGRRHVVGLVVRHGLVLAVSGLALGLLLSLALIRLIESQLDQTTSTDAATLVGVTAVLLVVALVASYVPARRATRADPMAALRGE